MDFEEFRRKKKAAEEAKEQAEEEANRPTASGKPKNWVDGLGPAGATNPKIKGFVLGRYRKRRVDPRTLKRPANYEATHAKSIPQGKDPAEIEMERKKAALKRAEEELERVMKAKALEDIEKRRAKGGIGKVKRASFF